MAKNLTEWLTKPFLEEDINIPVNVGDTILVGRFKNKKMKIKDIGKDKHGMPTINGRKATTFRIHSTVNIFDKEIDECIAVAKKFGDDIVIGKNRDRNYNPNLKIVRELSGYGVEICYVVDQDTDWAEGLNSEGIGIVNSALFVKRDEKDFDKAKKKKAMSKDGARIREALQHKTLKKAVKSLITYQEGIKGHTIISDGKKVVIIENTSRVEPSVTIHDIEGSPVVRANHGVQHPEQGYQRGPDKESSQLRAKNALDILSKEEDYKKFFPAFYNHTQDRGAKFDLVRSQNKLWTSSQLMMNLNKREVTLYLIPGAVKFLGIENTLPNDYESKIKLKVRQYEHGPSDKYDTYVTTDKKKKKSAIKDKDTSVTEGTKKEFIIWGIAPGKSREEILFTKAKSQSEAKKIIKILTKKHGVKRARIQVLDMAQDPKDIWKADKLFGEEFGAGVIPSPSRKGIKKNKTDRLSGYEKIEEFIHKPKMRRALNILVKKKLLPKNYATNISKLRSFLSSNPMIMTQLLRLLGENVNEQKQIKKVIGIYGGRFQPFGPHHLKTYKWLEKQVDVAYITTSDIKQPPRHPMNFREKVRHMKKMGIPSNRIIKEKTPYVAKNVLKKYDKDTTAVIYIFGAKDAGRLSGGKYFQDYKKNKNKMNGYEDNGYILKAPHISVSVGGKEVSGTTMRQLLGSPDYEKDREKLFKQAFGYYDKGIYNMMTNKFSKLFEFYSQPNVKKLIKEVSAFNSSFKGSSLSDEGMYDFFGSFADYKRISPRHAEILGWEVLGDILNDGAEGVVDPAFDYSFATMERPATVTYGRTVNQDTKNTDSVDNPFPKWKTHIQNIVDKLGWETIKWFGEPTVKVGDSHTFDMKDVGIGADKIKKLQESYQRDVEFLIEGGAYGHMSHPFDDNNLTFSDLKQIIINGLGGKLDREDNVTEKLDGQNLMVSWVDGELRAARNKGHLKNHGKTAPTTSGIKSMFSGRGDIEKAFVGAMKSLEKAVGSLGDKQKEKVFGNGSKWMNLEIMYPKTANVIDYDVAEIVFHGAIEYDDSGKAIGQPKDSARMLAGMIKQTNKHIQKMFRIGKPNFLTVPKHQDFGRMKNKFLGQLKKLQSTYALKDSDRLGEYHEAFWREYVFNASKQFKVSLKPNQFVSLVNRWAFFDKSYKIRDIKKDFKDNTNFLDWIISTDKNDIQNIFKQNIKPFEVLFFAVGAEILKNISGWMAASPSATTQKLRKDVIKAFKELQSGGNVDKLKKLKIQIEKLQAIGGLDAIVPSEGIVFKYKGKIYKFTGAFAPINQILGSLKFG
ncbi:hypothetical protein HOE22_12105 [Candidatus Woesearchaeota archaeon]|jgi:hypothetical protein|nr:hypothetical protein [Candidatus Woesearchaeota archaeon]